MGFAKRCASYGFKTLFGCSFAQRPYVALNRRHNRRPAIVNVGRALRLVAAEAPLVPLVIADALRLQVMVRPVDRNPVIARDALSVLPVLGLAPDVARRRRRPSAVVWKCTTKESRMQSLFERWFKGRFAELGKEFAKPESSDQYRARIEDLLDRQLSHVADYVYENYDQKDGRDAVKARLVNQANRDLVRERKRELTSRYSQLLGQYETLRSDRRNEDWANSVDHFKTLLYRFASGIMVVFLVLLCGYLSQRFAIPIPVLRVM